MEALIKIGELIHRGLSLVAPTVVVTIIGSLILFALVCLLKIFLGEDE